jgi:hypothetical protein
MLAIRQQATGPRRMNVRVIAVLTFVEIVGFTLGAYGLLRESFYKLGELRPFDEGRYGEGTYGGGLGRFTRVILWLAVVVHLLPRDRQLTLTDEKRNAGLAIIGTLLALTALAVQLVYMITSS